MTSFGVVPQGFNLKTFQQILDEIETDERAAFGAKINQQADSVLGILNGIFANKLAEMYELAQAVIAARSLDGATDQNLADLVALAGVKKNLASKGFAKVRFNLQAGASLAAGQGVISIGDGGEQWSLRTALANPSSGPQMFDAIVDCANTGIIPGNASSIDTLVTPVTGWSAKQGVDTLGSQPFPIHNGDQLIINSHTGSDVITFVNADFAIPGAATAAEVATKVNAVATGNTATALSDGRIHFEDKNTTSTCFDFSVSGPTGLPVTQDNFNGFNTDRGPTLLSGLAEPYNLSSGGTLAVFFASTADVNGTTFTATLPTGNPLTAYAVAAALVGQLGNVSPLVCNGKILLTCNGFVGPQTILQVTGGSAAAVFNFPETAVSGTSGDAQTGTDLETDAQMKARYLDSLFLPGSGTPPAIKAAVENVAGVEQAIVLQNSTSTTDPDTGIMPYGVEVIVEGGDDTAIANAILTKLAAGTPTYRDPGGQGRSVTVLDVNGDPQVVNFSRAEVVEIYIAVTVLVDPETFGNGDSLAGQQSIQQALKALGDANQNIGQDVIALRYRSSPLGLTGVIDVTAFAIDSVDPPTNTNNISITNTQVAQFSTTRIVVTVTS